MSTRNNRQLAIMVIIMTAITCALTYAAHSSEAVKARRGAALAGPLVGERSLQTEQAEEHALYAERGHECTTFVCDQGDGDCRVVTCE